MAGPSVRTLTEVALRVAVIGAGSWGTTVASVSAGNNDTVLWARRKDVADEIATRHTNGGYLPDVALPPTLRSTPSLEDAVGGADVVVMAVPSHGFRAVLEEAAPHIRAWVPVVSLSKGLEQGTMLRMTQVVNDVLPDHPAGALTGPNLAREIMAGHPAAAVMAFADERIAQGLQPVFNGPAFRVYTNLDIVGCEIAGVVKNVMAIAAGMVDGMGFGDNTKAAVMTRGLTELTKLGEALGGDPRTFAGLAGMGDLVATCMSAQSRNHRVGVELGRGRCLDDVVADTQMVAEGVRSSSVVSELAARCGVEMPIAEQVRAVCHDGVSAVAAMTALLERRAGAEWD
jgi:glycerol-3-phosphate dehydrogenase (NAD(P)+)